MAKGGWLAPRLEFFISVSTDTSPFHRETPPNVPDAVRDIEVTSGVWRSMCFSLQKSLKPIEAPTSLVKGQEHADGGRGSVSWSRDHWSALLPLAGIASLNPFKSPINK